MEGGCERESVVLRRRQTGKQGGTEGGLLAHLSIGFEHTTFAASHVHCAARRRKYRLRRGAVGGSGRRPVRAVDTRIGVAAAGVGEVGDWRDKMGKTHPGWKDVMKKVQKVPGSRISGW